MYKYRKIGFTAESLRQKKNSFNEIGILGKNSKEYPNIYESEPKLATLDFV